MAPRLGWDCYSDQDHFWDDLAAAHGKPLTSGSIYTTMSVQVANNFPTRQQDAAYIKANDGVVNLNINPWYFDVDTGQKVAYSWRDIVAGRYDNILKAWADAIKAFGSSRLQFGVGMHEPNISNINQPTTPDYDVTYFPYLVEKVHQFFKVEQQVPNRLAVYPTISVFRKPGPKKPALWDSFSPDPAHYDVLGADHYNHEFNWKEPAVTGEPFIATALALGKRWFVGECGNDCADDRRAKWYGDVAALYATPHGDKGQVANLVNFNVNIRRSTFGVGFGLRPGSPEWDALVAATMDWN